MLTKTTCDAIDLLNELARDHNLSESHADELSDEVVQLKTKLITNGLLDRFGNLTRSLYSISLLEILLAIGEGICPVVENKVEKRIYSKYSGASQMLGVINNVLRVFLNKITLADLWIVEDD